LKIDLICNNIILALVLVFQVQQ